MEPIFSEFSYGYAITEELVTGALGPLIGHPMFPSLKQEGQPGGGYDVKLPLIGAPLYLQFKRSHYMTRVYSCHWEYFGAPFFRMYIIPRRYSMQHELLIHLELSGNEVYYIAPEFHTDDDLTEYYMDKVVFSHSALFVPSDIGHLPDNKNHYVAFDQDSYAYFFSDEPIKIEKLPGKSFAQYYSSTYLTKSRKINEAFFDDLIDRTIEDLEKWGIATTSLKKTRSIRKEIETLGEKAIFAGFLTRAYFDAELFIVGE